MTRQVSTIAEKPPTQKPVPSPLQRLLLWYHYRTYLKKPLLPPKRQYALDGGSLARVPLQLYGHESQSKKELGTLQRKPHRRRDKAWLARRDRLAPYELQQRRLDRAKPRHDRETKPANLSKLKHEERNTRNRAPLT